MFNEMPIAFSVCLVVARNPLLARGLARVIACAGATPEIVSADGLEPALARGAQLACLSAEDLPALLPIVERYPKLSVLLLGSQRVDSWLEAFCGHPQLNHFLGLRYPDALPRSWELLAVVRRWVGGVAPGGRSLLSWGHLLYEAAPATVQDRDAAVKEVERMGALAVGERGGSLIAEVAHELLMNAMYDAPVDGEGCAVMAHRRNEAIQLQQVQRPHFLCGCDGARLVLSVSDPFGRLERGHFFGGLQRGLTTRTMDRRGGGAGLGFVVMYEASTMLLVDVSPGVRTQVTAVFELDVPQRELRLFPRSLHFFVGGIDDGTSSRN
jgi:hypothetical protein